MQAGVSQAISEETLGFIVRVARVLRNLTALV